MAEQPTNNQVVRKVFASPGTARPSFGRGGAIGGANRPGGNRPGGNRPGGNRGGRFGADRPKPEFDQKTINVRRVARVVSGGRRFSFSVALIAGDKNGRVGVGVGKAGDTALAVEKALNKAKKAMIRVNMTDKKSIPHEVSAKYKSARVDLRPAKGRGLVAGSAVRVVLALAGLHDVNAKIVSRSKDKLNIARAAILALSSLKTKAPKTTEAK
ncbi:MAG: 30S ribosomal protein S5 [Candidatus Paceibacterota bacterium]|jgi:small subunit ribosomal protein S5